MANRADELSLVPEDDLSWCYDAVQDVSRTFAISIDLLNEPMASYVCVGYLVCRIADTIEDSQTLSATEKAFLLERYDRVLDPANGSDVDTFETVLEPHLPAERTADWAVVADVGRVLRTFERLPSDVRTAVVPPTRELVDGMAMFVERHAEHDGIRIQSEAELEEYCYYVAGTVGHLTTNLIVRDITDETVVEQLRTTATGFGLVLQLVNVAKDVHADYTHENSVYLPADWLDEAGVVQEAVLSPHNRQAVASVVARTVEHARSSLDEAHAYLDVLSDVDRNAFVASAVPFLLAVGTLRELSKRPEDALRPGGVKVSHDEVMAVVAAVTTDTGPQSLAALRESVRRGDLR